MTDGAYKYINYKQMVNIRIHNHWLITITIIYFNFAKKLILCITYNGNNFFYLICLNIGDHKKGYLARPYNNIAIY